MPLPIGTRLGPYEIQSAIGAGGMGEVYRARDTRLDRSVAVKILPSDVAEDPDLRIRFEREARAVAALDHPNICGIYDVGSVDGTHYLVMPHLDGQTLAARLEKGPLPLDQALKIAGEIADALDRTHRNGIVHRDLKPGNIMLTKTGSKLLDFGLAKLRAPAGPISMSGMTRLATYAPGTAQGVILGTVQYMAPEQIEGREADPRSDVWALGAVIYEMVTGSRPFTGDTPASIIGSILKDEAPRASARQPVVPTALDHLLTVCLAKDPDDRWQSAGDVKRQLDWIARGDSGKPSASNVAKRSSATLAAALVVSALLGAAAVSVIWWSKPAAEGAQQQPTVFTVSPPPGFNLAGPAASTSVPQLALSPDGRLLVFVVADAQGQQHLWLRAFDDPIARRLPGTDGATDPFWSPDSKRVGFISLGMLKSIGADGQSPQTIGRAVIDSRGGSWNVDGDILLYGGRTGAISRLRVAGGPAGEVILDGMGAVRWPEFLPDNRHFLFQVRVADPDRMGIYVGALDGSGLRRLVGSDWAAHYGSGHLLFLDGRTLMAQQFDPGRLELIGSAAALLRDVGGSSSSYGSFSVSATGVLAYTKGQSNRSELRWVDRAGTPGPVILEEADYVDMSLSPDQSRVAYSKVDEETQAADVWILDLVRGTSTRITTERLADTSPVWSSDGSEILFRSNRSSSIGVELYRTRAGPGGSVRLILGAADSSGAVRTNLKASDWLRDGRILYWHSTAEAGYGIWSMPSSGDDPRAILETPNNELYAALSADGRWMAYASDQSGQYEVYVQDFPAGAQREMISTGGGTQPQWRRDGRELYYLAADGSIMQVAVAGGDRFSAAAPRRLFKTAMPSAFNPYRMDYLPAGDGQRFLMKVPVTREAPVITVVLNWPALLKE